MKKILSILVLLLAFMACKKRFADPTYAPNATAVRVWYQPTQYYTPDAEIFLDSSNRWWRVTAFPLVYDNDPNKYGFGNPWTPGRGSNALYMNTIYGRLPGGVTSDSGYYNITIPKAFELIPDNDTATQGKVNVIPQLVKIFRRDKTSFNIGISGGGTYNEQTQLMEVEVIFDETEIGGSKEVKRKYRFRP